MIPRPVLPQTPQIEKSKLPLELGFSSQTEQGSSHDTAQLQVAQNSVVYTQYDKNRLDRQCPHLFQN